MTSNLDARKRLQNKILELGNEKIKIIQKIADITVQINSLRAKHKQYVDMLANAKEVKKALERDCKAFDDDIQKLFGKIKSAEERQNEIQKDIDKLNEQETKIKLQLASIKVMRNAALACKMAADDYDRKHTGFWANLTSFIGDFVGNLYVSVKEIKQDLINEITSLLGNDFLLDKRQKEYEKLLNSELDIVKNLFFDPEGKPKIITQTTFELIMSELTRREKQLFEDQNSLLNKIEQHRQDMKSENLKNQVEKEYDQKAGLEDKTQARRNKDLKELNAYSELITQLGEGSDVGPQIGSKIQEINDLNKKQNFIDEDIEAYEETYKTKLFQNNEDPIKYTVQNLDKKRTQKFMNKYTISNKENLS